MNKSNNRLILTQYKTGLEVKQNVISSDDIDKIILKALMEEANGGVWYQHLKDYYDNKYNKSSDSKTANI